MIRINNKFIEGFKICPLTAKIFNEKTGEVKNTRNSNSYEFAYINGTKILIHRALACTYYGYQSRNHVHHIDGNRLNNILTNLEWKTPEDHGRETRLNEIQSGKIIHGMTGKHHSKKTKLKLREANLGRTLSSTTRQLISDKNKGGNNPFYGQRHSEKTKQLISKKSKGFVFFNDGKRNIRAKQQPGPEWNRGRLKKKQ